MTNAINYIRADGSVIKYLVGIAVVQGSVVVLYDDKKRIEAIINLEPGSRIEAQEVHRP